MNDRRKFLGQMALSAGALAVSRGLDAKSLDPRAPEGGRVVSTWDFGVGANQAAWARLVAGSSGLDGV